MASTIKKKVFIKHLKQGGLVAYPTEAVFGLGCDPLNAVAVARLMAVKGRPKSKGFILIASDLKQFNPFVMTLSDEIISRILDVNQEPTTWVLPANDIVPDYLTSEDNTIAIRLVQHGLAKQLCDLAGMAIVSTSANFSGALPLKDGYKTRIKFSKYGVFTINGCVGSALKPSRIIDPILKKRYR